MGQMIPAFESRRLEPGKTVPGAYYLGKFSFSV